MGAVYAINATLKLQEKKRKDLFEKLSSEIMEDLTSGEVDWGDIQKPETLEECLGLIFVEHQKMYDIKISKDKEQETIEIDSGFSASYGWESVMINYFKTMAPFLDNMSDLVIYPDSDYDHLIIEDGKSIQLH